MLGSRWWWMWAGCLLGAGCAREEPRASEQTETGRQRAARFVEDAAAREAAKAARFEGLWREATAGRAELRAVRIAAVLRVWAREDLTGARRAAALLTDSEDWWAAHEVLLAAALEKDVREAVAWLKGLKPAERAAVLMDQALAPWVGVDAHAAGAHVAALGESDYRTALAGEVAGAWVRSDASAATAWSASLGDQEAREEALRVVIGAVAETEPRRAAELALRVPGEGDRAVALEQVVEAWWARDAAGLLAWSDRLPAGEERVRVGRLIEAQRQSFERVE